MLGIAEELTEIGYSRGHGYACLQELAAALGDLVDGGVLRPRLRSESRPDSLSGLFGKGAFPWHTDGANSMLPPRWMVLYAADVESSVGTELLVPTDELVRKLTGTLLKTTDGLGRVRHVPAVTPLGGGRTRLRWDPRSCPPNDPAMVDLLGSADATTLVNWRNHDFLVVDNFRVLHRRPAVVDDLRREIRRYYIGG